MLTLFLSKKSVCVQKLKIKSKEIPVYHEGFLLGKGEDLKKIFREKKFRNVWHLIKIFKKVYFFLLEFDENINLG